MNFQFAHYNYNVIDLDKSIRFYEEALGLKELRRKEAEDGSFILVYLGDGETGFEAGAYMASGLGKGSLQSGR